MKRIVFFLILLSLPWLGQTAVAAEQAPQPSHEGLWISTPFPSANIAAGSSLDLDLKVTNAGLPPQRVKLDVTSAPEGWRTVFIGDGRPVRAVFVEPDGSSELKLRILPPEAVQAGSYEFELTAQGDDQRFTLPIELSVGEVIPAKLTLATELPSLRGTPSSSFEYDITLKNESSREAVVSLEAATPPGFRVTFKERFGSKELTSVPVKGGEERELKVEIEPHPQIEAGTYQVAVRALTEGANAALDLTLDITGRPELSLTGVGDRLSGDARAGEETPFDLVLSNRGTAATQQIEFSSSEPTGWKVTFDPETVDALAAGEQRKIKALVTPSSEAIAGDYMVTLRANGDGASESSEFRVTVRTSTLWGMAGVGVIAASLAVLAVAVTRFGRR